MIHTPAGAPLCFRHAPGSAIRRPWRFRPVYGTYMDLLGSASFRGR